MIYLLTGTPGTGKTAFLMDCVLKNKFGLFKDDDGNFRPMFSVNLTVKDRQKLPISPVPPDDFVSMSLHDNFEDGSLIIVDEASEIYPVRAAASKLPAHVEGLNTLRHHGLTLILITQAPTMIDIFVRNLVGKHWHIDRKQIGSRFYEWNKCITSPGKVYFQEAYSEIYKPNKEVFGLYESATKHIKFKKQISWHYKAVPILIVLLVVIVYTVYSSIFGLADDVGVKGKAVNQSLEQASDFPESGKADTFSDFRQPERPASASALITSDYFKPRISDRPETAPIYDGVRVVTDFPRVVGCVKRQTAKDTYSCTCYTQQGSPADVDVTYCINYLRNRPFDPYRPVHGDRERLINDQTS